MLLHKVFRCTINNSWDLKGTMHEREQVIQKHLPIVIFGFFAWFGYVHNISTSLSFGAPSKLGGKRSSSHKISSHNMLER